MSELVAPPQIKELLEDKGFDVEDIIPNSRYFIARGTMSEHDGPLVFKSISKPGARNLAQLRNQILWAKSVAPQVPKDASFHVVPVLESGTTEAVAAWFISPFVEGAPLATTKDAVSTITIEHPEIVVPRVAELARFIGSVGARTLAGVDTRFSRPNKKPATEAIHRAIVWARGDTPYVVDLLQLVEVNAEYLSEANAHGDFTETNIVVTEMNEPALFDGELANANDFKHYDATEFYHRLVARAGEPDLARAFLTAYMSHIPEDELQICLNNIITLSAMRCLGNYFELESMADSKARRARLVNARLYAELVVSGEIINV